MTTGYFLCKVFRWFSLIRLRAHNWPLDRKTARAAYRTGETSFDSSHESKLSWSCFKFREPLGHNRAGLVEDSVSASAAAGPWHPRSTGQPSQAGGDGIKIICRSNSTSQRQTDGLGSGHHRNFWNCWIAKQPFKILKIVDNASCIPYNAKNMRCWRATIGQRDVTLRNMLYWPQWRM